MDNVILVASGVLVSGLFILIWTIVKIKQLDSPDKEAESDDEFSEDSLIKLSPPKVISAKSAPITEAENTPFKEHSGAALAQETVKADMSAISNLEKKIDSIESSIKSLYGLISESNNSTGGNDVLGELKNTVQELALKLNGIAASAGAKDRSASDESARMLNEVLSGIKQLSGKIDSASSEQKSIGLNLLGEGAGNDMLFQKMEEIRQLYSGLKDGEEEILSQIINKLDILNRIITSHITKN